MLNSSLPFALVDHRRPRRKQLKKGLQHLPCARLDLSTTYQVHYKPPRATLHVAHM